MSLKSASISKYKVLPLVRAQKHPIRKQSVLTQHTNFRRIHIISSHFHYNFRAFINFPKILHSWQGWRREIRNTSDITRNCRLSCLIPPPENNKTCNIILLPKHQFHSKTVKIMNHEAIYCISNASSLKQPLVPYQTKRMLIEYYLM